MSHDKSRHNKSDSGKKPKGAFARYRSGSEPDRDLVQEGSFFVAYEYGDRSTTVLGVDVDREKAKRFLYSDPKQPKKKSKHKK